MHTFHTRSFQKHLAMYLTFVAVVRSGVETEGDGKESDGCTDVNWSWLKVIF